MLFSGYCRNQFMFRSNYHEINPEDRIRPCSKHFEFVITVYNGKIHFSTIAFTDPVGLHFFHCLAEVHCIQAFQQTVCIFSYA